MVANVYKIESKMQAYARNVLPHQVSGLSRPAQLEDQHEYEQAIRVLPIGRNAKVCRNDVI